MPEKRLIDLAEILRLENLTTRFGENRPVLDGLTLSITQGAVIALIGESGAGKSVLCRLILGLDTPQQGSIVFEGRPMPGLRRRSFDDCASMQYIFQDAYAALVEEWTVEAALQEAARLCARQSRSVLDPAEALDLCGLAMKEHGKRKIASLSGGQRQRVNIARALIPRPKLLIADECTAMLDGQAACGIYDLFRRLRTRMGLTILLVTHDARALHGLCDNIAVLCGGKIVEQGEAASVISNPGNAYTLEYMRYMKQIDGDWSKPSVSVEGTVK